MIVNLNHYFIAYVPEHFILEVDYETFCGFLSHLEDMHPEYLFIQKVDGISVTDFYFVNNVLVGYHIVYKDFCTNMPCAVSIKSDNCIKENCKFYNAYVEFSNNGCTFGASVDDIDSDCHISQIKNDIALDYPNNY